MPVFWDDGFFSKPQYAGNPCDMHTIGSHPAQHDCPRDILVIEMLYNLSDQCGSNPKSLMVWLYGDGCHNTYPVILQPCVWQIFGNSWILACKALLIEDIPCGEPDDIFMDHTAHGVDTGFQDVLFHQVILAQLVFRNEQAGWQGLPGHIANPNGHLTRMFLVLHCFKIIPVRSCVQRRQNLTCTIY